MPIRPPSSPTMAPCAASRPKASPATAIAASSMGASEKTVKKAMEAKSPLGRVCDPEDVSAAIVGLITGSDLVTGVVLPVEGGMLIAG